VHKYPHYTPVELTQQQFETIGYAARAAAHNDTVSKTPYIIQSILILIAPILFAASIYMILGRLITRTNSAPLSIIRSRWVTKIFVAGDILSFFVQSGGAGMLVRADSPDAVKRGENIILGGLILQILIFGFFVVVAATWHRRLDERPTAAAAELHWRKYVRLLYAASALITIRNTCRVVEYALGRVQIPFFRRLYGLLLMTCRMDIYLPMNGHFTCTIFCRWCLHLLSVLLGMIQISR
jgi:hypothetical protein